MSQPGGQVGVMGGQVGKPVGQMVQWVAKLVDNLVRYGWPNWYPTVFDDSTHHF